MSDMSAEAVFWALFDALGYAAGIDESAEEQDRYFLLKPNGYMHTAGNEGHFAERLFWECVPRWPTDLAAALILCHELAAFHYHSVVTRTDQHGAWVCFAGDGPEFGKWTHAATPAFALSKLALLALRERDA